MKRTISVFVMIACLLALFALSVSAEQDILATKFQDTLRILDNLYNYDANYMLYVANSKFISWDDEDGIEIVPAAEYEAVLHKYFFIDDAMLQAIRTCDEGFLQYNASDNTYTLYAGGGFGGILPPREYRGYVRNGATYEVYYGHLTYENLEDVLPEGTSLEDIVGDEWPSTVEYGGNVYESSPEGYTRIVSRDPYGRKYTVELNGDIVRIISCVNYTEGQQPGTFDENEVLYDFPEDNSVIIPDNDCFEGNTTVIVEEVKTGETMNIAVEAMETVAEEYVVYEFTATKNNSSVQPNGKLTVTFAIPEGYSNNIVVYYMAKTGALEKLNTTVNTNDRTVTAELEHFSTYIVSDESTKPEPQPTDGPQPTDAPDTPDPTEAPDVPDPTDDPNVPDPTDTPNVPDPTDTPNVPDPTDAPDTTPQPNDDESPDYTGVIIAVVAVVVIAGGVAVFLVIKKKGNKAA